MMPRQLRRGSSKVAELPLKSAKLAGGQSVIAALRRRERMGKPSIDVCLGSRLGGDAKIAA